MDHPSFEIVQGGSAELQSISGSFGRIRWVCLSPKLDRAITIELWAVDYLQGSPSLADIRVNVVTCDWSTEGGFWSNLAHPKNLSGALLFTIISNKASFRALCRKVDVTVNDALEATSHLGLSSPWDGAPLPPDM